MKLRVPSNFRHAALKSSQQRALIQLFASQFNLSPSSAKLAFPPSISHGRIDDHGDVVLYLAIDDSTPVYIQYKDTILPTLYTVWRHPSTYIQIFTNATVLQKLMGGAGLMIPGILFLQDHVGLLNGQLVKDVIKGQVVVICDYLFPHRAQCVGIVESDSTSWREKDKKGKGVETVHFYEDQIWALRRGQYEEFYSNTAGESIGYDIRQAISDQNEQSIEEEKTPDPDTSIISDDWVEIEAEAEVETQAQAPAQNKHLEDLSLENDVHKEESITIEETKGIEDKQITDDLTTEEIDKLYIAELLAIWHPKSKVKPSLLISQSTALSLLPQTLPPLKKTSWKKAAKLLKSLGKDGIITIKEAKGEVSILSINDSHSAFDSVKPAKKKSTVNDTEDKDQKQKTLIISQSYSPSGKVSELLSGEYMSSKEVREQTLAYIQEKSLISSNQRLVNLDFVLSQIVGDKIKGTRASREDLLKAILSACTPYYSIQHGTDDKRAMKKGSPPVIKIMLQTRSGNKVVTKISNIEPYHIEPQDLADELKLKCASSTAISEIGKGKSEVMVQGPQSKIVINILEALGIGKDLWEIVDKVKK